MTCNNPIGYPTTLKSFIEISCSYILNDGYIIKNIELNPLDYLEVKNILNFTWYIYYYKYKFEFIKILRKKIKTTWVF